MLQVTNTHASQCFLKFKLHEFGGSASSNVIDVLTLRSDRNSVFEGALTVKSTGDAYTTDRGWLYIQDQNTGAYHYIPT